MLLCNFIPAVDFDKVSEASMWIMQDPSAAEVWGDDVPIDVAQQGTGNAGDKREL